MKRAIRIALALVGALTVAAAGAFWQTGRAGSGAIEAWIAGQIQLVADTYLHPKLTFTDLDYEFPATVRLKSLRLTADDPANPGRTLDILGCEQAEIELTELPRAGQPIQIASIVLHKPLFQAVAVGDGSTRLIGFSELIRQSPAAAKPATRPATSSIASSVAPGVPRVPQVPQVPPVPRLSEFLRMRCVELIDGQIISDPRLPGIPRMQIDQINTRLAIEPAAMAEAGGGWYTIDARITREPIFHLAIVGRLNLDTFTAADAVITLNAQVAREHDRYLPPELQNFLRRHEVQGALEATITGTMPLLDPARGRVQMQARLTDANVSHRDYRIPVDALVLSAALEEGALTLSKLELNALGGAAQVKGSLALNPPLDADLRLIVRDMILDQTIRDGTAAANAPRYGGRLNAHLAAAAPLRSLAATTTQPVAGAWGGGRIDIDRGRLVHVPLVHGIGRAITRSASWLTGRGGSKSPGSDRARVIFTLHGREARCSEITYVGDLFAARGRGSVRFDQQLDLIVNAGPLEKMQSLMGRHVGGAFGKLTDAIAGYRVTGTVAEPQIDLQLAGGRVNQVGRSVTSGIGKLVDGVTNLAGAGDE